MSDGYKTFSSLSLKTKQMQISRRKRHSIITEQENVDSGTAK